MSIGTLLEVCSAQAMDSSLKIVIVDENPIRAAILEDGLREAGHVQVVRIDETAHLLARIYAIDPDVILIDLENPSRDVLEQMFQVSRAVKRPVAMFVDQSDTRLDRGRGRRRRLGLHRRRPAARSASRTSSICASRASTPSRGCRTSSSAPARRSRSARSSTAPRAF